MMKYIQLRIGILIALMLIGSIFLAMLYSPEVQEEEVLIRPVMFCPPWDINDETNNVSVSCISYRMITCAPFNSTIIDGDIYTTLSMQAKHNEGEMLCEINIDKRVCDDSIEGSYDSEMVEKFSRLSSREAEGNISHMSDRTDKLRSELCIVGPIVESFSCKISARAFMASEEERVSILKEIIQGNC
jgi:hypothetical protein